MSKGMNGAINCFAEKSMFCRIVASAPVVGLGGSTVETTLNLEQRTSRVIPSPNLTASLRMLEDTSGVVGECYLRLNRRDRLCHGIYEVRSGTKEGRAYLDLPIPASRKQ